MIKKVLLIFLCATLLLSAGNKLEEGMSIPKFFVRIYNNKKSGIEVIRDSDLFNGKNRAVVISFFASYCKPCKKEIFVLNDFYQKYKDKGVTIIEISIDTEKDGIELFKKIVDETDIAMPCVIDTMGAMSRRFGVERLPALFVFDKYGYVKKKFEGYTEENVKGFEEVVLELMGDKPETLEKRDSLTKDVNTSDKKELPEQKKDK
ncbi:MAG: TlpA disulfide reductase family protein [Myxococcota bacterium]